MKISFLASHGGTVARQIIEAIRRGELLASIGVVITNNRESLIRRWCLENDVQSCHISQQTHPNNTDETILEALKAVQTDLVVFSGYMKKVWSRTVVEYRDRILNIHPSLLPRHGGKGMYGDRVHLAVLQSGDPQSGATVHLLNEEYDEGPVLLQQKIPVTGDETLESLKAKVRQLEGPLCIEAISKFMHNHALQTDAATQRR